jgi:hypothetical protein
MKKEHYHCITIPGKVLKPGFSVYLFEIKHGKEKYFYIGMTGDNFYPSARSAFHRLSGHFDLTENSTQNQLLNALKDKGIDFEKEEDLTILMHHFAIPGFTKWKVSLKGVKKENLEHDSDYKAYKKLQQEVLALENTLIIDFKDKLLNKTAGKKHELSGLYLDIYNDIKKLLKNERVETKVIG